MNWIDGIFKKTEKGGYKGLINILFVFGLGIILLLLSSSFFNKIPSNTSANTQNLKNQVSTNINNNQDSYEDIMEKKLIDIFSNIEGVGKVDVMLTLETGKEMIVNKDTPSTENISKEEDGEGGTRETRNIESKEETVLTNSGNGTSEPIILQEKQPTIKGIIIIAQGGDQPVVQEKLTKAAEVLLGIPSHRVQIFKMKSK